MMSKSDLVWVVDDDHSIRRVVSRALKKSGFEVVEFENAAGVIESLIRDTPDAIISDIRMPGESGLALLHEIHQHNPELPVIIITAHADLDSAVSAYQGGAFEYLPKPFDLNEITELVSRAIQHSRRQNAGSIEGSLGNSSEIIGSASSMQEVFRAIGRLSMSSINVLITGESGTGKELIARALHRHSPSADGPFIALNTAAISRELLESELFGHEKGAFTGAQNMRKGRFEQADGGSLFLDEIGDMPAELQTRLLRVLAEGDFYRVGGHSPLRAKVRIIAATHQELEKKVQEGAFREDLYHRLNVVRIRVPALRERKEDIPELANYFLASAAKELKMDRKTLTKEVENLLTAFNWPGNVRQLENVCRWLTVMTPSQEVHTEDIPKEINEEISTASADWDGSLKQWARDQFNRGRTGLMDEATPIFEKVMIQVALEKTAGKRQEAAALLGWGRNTLTRKIRDLGMDEDA